jgi:hypothetical protein
LVEDRTLWEAADLKYEAYVDASAELVEKGLAVTVAGSSDFPGLRVTNEGTKRIKGS